MPSIALQRHDVIVGVDTHKDEHIAVAIDGLGGLIDKPKLAAATPDGYAELLVWAQSLGEIHAFRGRRAAGRTVRVSPGSFAVTATKSMRSLDRLARVSGACPVRVTPSMLNTLHERCSLGAAPRHLNSRMAK